MRVATYYYWPEPQETTAKHADDESPLRDIETFVGANRS
jgi:hypothetical protein